MELSFHLQRRAMKGSAQGHVTQSEHTRMVAGCLFLFFFFFCYLVLRWFFFFKPVRMGHGLAVQSPLGLDDIP